MYKRLAKCLAPCRFGKSTDKHYKLQCKAALRMEKCLALRISMTERNVLTGIDPGIGGALAVLEMEHGWARPRLMECLDLDGSGASFGCARRMLERSCVIVVERQQASPQMGRRSAFELGRQVGLVRGMLGTLGLTPVMVSPTVWRGSFGLGGGADGKAAGMALAAELLGADADRALYRHDIADAVLLAWWGWRHAVAEVEDAAW